VTGASGGDIGAIVEQYLDHLAARRRDPPDLTHLPVTEQEPTQRLLDALRAAWQADLDAPPPLDHDPLAISLGLVPDPARPLAGPALRQARRRAQLQVSDVGRRLSARGWPTSTADVAAWERQAATPVKPAVIAALAAELAVPIEQLITAPSSRKLDRLVAEVSATKRFGAITRRWANLLGLPGDAAASASLQQLMAAGHVRRGHELTAEEWLSVLEALVDARESSAGGETT